MAAASLAQVKMGMEGLALCIAGVLCERDPSLLAAFQERVEMLYRVLDDRGDHEAADDGSRVWEGVGRSRIQASSELVYARVQ
jgi:hypothetical protein